MIKDFIFDLQMFDGLGDSDVKVEGATATVGSWAGLVAASTNTSVTTINITMTGKDAWSDTAISSGTEIIDLTGKTLNISAWAATTENSTVDDHVIKIGGDAKVTIKGGKIVGSVTGTAPGTGVFSVGSNASLTLDGVEFVTSDTSIGSTAVVVEGGTLTIKSGTTVTGYSNAGAGLLYAWGGSITIEKGATIEEESTDGYAVSTVNATINNKGTIKGTNGIKFGNSNGRGGAISNTGVVEATQNAFPHGKWNSGTTVFSIGGTISGGALSNDAGSESVVVSSGTYSFAGGSVIMDSTTTITATVNGVSFKSSASGTATAFTLNDSVVSGVSGLSSNTTIYGDLTGLTSIEGSGTSITGDTTIEITGGSKLTFSSVSGGAVLSGAALAGATVNTDSEGSFTLGGTDLISISGDKSVAFTLDSETVVSGIGNFNEAGTISGALEGVWVSSDTSSTTAISVTGDDTIAVVSDGKKNFSLEQISNGATIKSTGGIATVKTDEAGTFTFGSGETQSVTVTGDSDGVIFTVDTTANTATAVSSITGGTLAVSSETNALTINGTEIAFSGTSLGATFVLDNNGKITEVSNVSVVNELTGNVTVDAATSVTVNKTSIDIAGDTDYKVAVVNGAVGEIFDVSGGATMAAVKSATIKTDEAGTFTFGDVGYTIDGDNEVTFYTDGDGKLASIGNFESGSVKTTVDAVVLNGNKVSVGGGNKETLTYSVDENGSLSAVDGLANGVTVTGAGDAALGMVGTSSANATVSLTVEENTYQLLGDEDGVTIAGGVITGLAADASLIAAKGKYTVNGTALELSEAATIRGTEEETAEIYDPSNLTTIDSGVSSLVAELSKEIIPAAENYSLVGETDEEREAIGEALSGSTDTAVTSILSGDVKFSIAVPSSDEDGVQDIDLSEFTGKKNVTLNDSVAANTQNITFNDEGGNVAQVDTDAAGTKNITLGDGGDVVAVAEGTSAEVNVTAGEGEDTIWAGSDAKVDVGKGGATKLRAISKKAVITVENYDHDKKAGVMTTKSDIAAAIRKFLITLTNASVNAGEGTIVFGSGATSSDLEVSADDDTSTGYQVVNLYNHAGTMSKVGYTYEDGGTVDLSGQKDGVIIQGNNTSANKSDEYTGSLLGGKGDDTIFGGSGDVINAGAGSNTIELRAADERSEGAEKGATIDMRNSKGRNVVSGFSEGFGSTNDVVKVDLSSAKFTIDDGNLVITDGSAKTTLTSNTSSDDEDGTVKYILVNDTVKTAVTDDSTIAVSADSLANRYIGDGAGLDFSDFTGDVRIQLLKDREGKATLGGELASVNGFDYVQLGEGTSTLYGSKGNETLAAGAGAATIWSAAGNDAMVGSYTGNEDDKENALTFGFLKGDGKDTLSNFEFLTSDGTNSLTADEIYTTTDFVFDTLTSDGSVRLKFADDVKDKLTITDAKGQNIQLRKKDGDTEVWQVSDSELTYDGTATRYIATENASLVASSGTSSANIWLNKSSVYDSKIVSVSAADVDGEATLVGNSSNNAIEAAQGNTSLWGGRGDDTLIGGDGDDVFVYGVRSDNEGADVIQGASENDTINLYNIKNSDINWTSSEITDSTIKLVFNRGGSLTVDNVGATFVLNNNSNYAYTYDTENSKWVRQQ